MPKVYCIHHWITTKKKVKECTICGEFWDPAIDKKPPTVAIGILPDYAPFFSDADTLLKDKSNPKTKGPAVYCEHVWDTFGPDTYRCMRCRSIWKKFKNPEEPKIIIGYSQNPSDS